VLACLASRSFRSTRGRRLTPPPSLCFAFTP
jgi:hypothetical protein